MDKFSQQLLKHGRSFRNISPGEIEEFHYNGKWELVFEMLDELTSSEILELMSDERLVNLLPQFDQNVVRSARFHLKRYGALTWRQWAFVTKVWQLYLSLDDRRFSVVKLSSKSK
jgi:uncharacterized protein (DUF2249 family)